MKIDWQIKFRQNKLTHILNAYQISWPQPKLHFPIIQYQLYFNQILMNQMWCHECFDFLSINMVICGIATSKYDKGAFDDPFWSCYFDIFWDPYLYISFFLNSDIQFCHLLRIIVQIQCTFDIVLKYSSGTIYLQCAILHFYFISLVTGKNLSLILQKDLIFDEWWKSLLAEQFWSYRISFFLRFSRSGTVYCTLFKMAIYK